jgi:hypothetical protein
VAKQPEQQQQQGALARTHPCPTCKQAMRLVGRESLPGSSTYNLLTFQCQCGQVIATQMH